MNSQKTRIIITAVPLVICNLIAFTGQLAFIRDHMQWPLIADIGFAAGLESIALYLAYMANEALKAEDSAFRLRMGSYIMALIAGALNYSHYSASLQPTFAAIGTAIMSSISPVLWGIYARRNSRDSLKAKGLIESLAVKFGMNRWLWWPGRTFGAYRLAAWSGERNPAAAIAQWEASRAVTPEPEPRMSLADATTQADAVRVALRESGHGKASDVAAWLAERGFPGITAAYVRQIRSVDARKAASERRSGIHAIANPDSVRALPGGTV